MHLSVGQKVTWTSQSGGISKTKIGIIEQVVDADDLPDRDSFPQLYKQGIGMSRGHKTYVVRVENKLYWPRTRALSLFQN